MISNLGDEIAHREYLFECFIEALKLLHHFQQFKERIDKAADVLNVKIDSTDRESLLLIIQNKAEKNMRNIGYLLDFNDIELNHIYRKYEDVGCELSDSELKDFIEYYYNIPNEVFQEEITDYDVNNEVIING